MIICVFYFSSLKHQNTGVSDCQKALKVLFSEKHPCLSKVLIVQKEENIDLLYCQC